MKILIVEDIADDRRILRYNFERHGCEVIEASDGQEGLELATVHKPHLIISDALMPRMDGFQLLRNIRKDENLKSIPFVFYSAVYTGYKEVELALSLGANAYIVKPKEPEEFWNEIQDVLGKYKLKREPAIAAELIEEEEEYLRKYSNIVATKLEEKVLELERAITERKRSEEALMESKERMNAIFESSMDAIIMVDEKGIISYFNPSAERMFGYRRGEAIGKSLHHLIVSEEIRGKYYQAFPEFEKTGQCRVLGKHLEINAMRKDGTSFPAEISIVSMKIKGKRHSSGTVRDITERKRAETVLRESEINLARSQTIAHVGNWSRNILNDVVSWSDEMFRIHGIAPEEFEGTYAAVAKLVHPEDLPRYEQSIASALQGGLVEPFEYRVLRPDGAERIVEMSGIDVGRDAEGKALSMFGVLVDITDRKHAEETIKYQTYHDLLTGLSNKARFLDLLNHEIPQMQRVRKKLAVLFLDIDYFKNVNDSLGHAAGDKVILDVAGRLKRCVRQFDTIARIGADEFTILLSLVSQPEDAAGIADTIMETFKKPFIIEDHELHLTASIGISLFPEDGKNAESLIRNADIALHHAKAQGRNNFQFYNPAINIRTLERILLENSLRRAAGRGELEVYYQPQMDIRTRRIVGAEALVRWKHPELGLLDPVRFIPLAEEIGLIVQIDQWVLRTACGQLKTWQKAGYALPFVTVNLSARQFQQPNLAEAISEALEETELGSESLGIEITETLTMQDTELTFRNLNQLKTMGIRFSIDDFGTGYSSLSYLKKLPIHKLKIDKSFITDLTTDRDYQAIINAIIAMAHIMKLKVVAEGVETEDQMSFLNSRDCDEMQGYLFSKPVPAEEFEKLLV